MPPSPPTFPARHERSKVLLGLAMITLASLVSRGARAEPADSARAQVAQQAPIASPSEGVSFRDWIRSAPVLTDGELEQLRARVRARCAVTSAPQDEAMPWYYHFELARELAERGDLDRSLDAFILALDEGPTPGRESRMYGMWFVDFRPYLEITRLHLMAGRPECAAAALRASVEAGELREDGPEAAELEALGEELGWTPKPEP